MGKFREELQRAIDLRQIHSSNMSDLGAFMDDYGKSNTQAQIRYFEDQIANLLPLVLDEMMEELIRRFDIKVKDEATPALQSLRQELQNLGK